MDDETEMEEEEGKRQKDEVACRIYRRRKGLVSSGHKLQVKACKPRAFLPSGTYPICIFVVILVIKNPFLAKMISIV